MLWEPSLAVFADSNQKSIVQRAQLAGPGAPGWISALDLTHPTSIPTTAGGYDLALWYWQQSGSKLLVSNFGINLNWDNINAVSQFATQSANILGPLTAPPNANGEVDPNSFAAGTKALQGFDDWLTFWMPLINKWADAIGDTGSDWEGSAAAAFKYTLIEFANELDDFHTQMNTPVRWSDLTTAGSQLTSTLATMGGANSAWNASIHALPQNCVVGAFDNVMNNVSPSWVSNGDSPYLQFPDIPGYGYPGSADFLTNVNNLAQMMWLANVNDFLDDAVEPAMQALQSAYQMATNNLGSLLPISLAPPSSTTNLNSNSGGGGGSNLNAPNSNLNVGGGGGAGGGSNLNLNTPNGNVSVGGGGGTGNLGGANLNTPNGVTDLAGGGSALNSGGLNLNGGSGAGSEDTVDGPNGQPLDDAAGDPLLVPAGSTIDSSGEVIGPNGQPVLGADGKPITVPKGSTIGQSDGAGGNVVVPQGSKINPNGTVTAPNGKEVLDANGNPLVLAKGSTIGADGTVLGPNGKTVSMSSQLLTDQEQALAGAGTSLVTTGGGGTLTTPYSGAVSTVGGGEITGTGASLSQAALDSGTSLDGLSNLGLSQATPTSGGDATGTAGAATAASTGTTAAAQSGDEMPMMPSMGGGGGQQNGQDRQRTTWLAEEEEVWGTDVGAVSGTIGR
jgi:hypothetical protein